MPGESPASQQLTCAEGHARPASIPKYRRQATPAAQNTKKPFVTGEIVHPIQQQQANTGGEQTRASFGARV